MSAYHFVESKYCRPQGGTVEYVLEIRQQPRRAKVCTHKEKERRPIDPPPIIQLRLKDESQDPCQNYLQSPHLFLQADLCYPVDNGPQNTVNSALAGTCVSSLYRLKDQNNTEAGFFVFGDLSVKKEGDFRLRFYLFEVRGEHVHYLQSITSDVFTAFNQKDFPGLEDSTFMSRSFADQGVKIKIRKVRRIQMKRSPLRPNPSAERGSQYGVLDQRAAGTHYPVAGRVTPYDERPNPEYHYAGGPIRHGARPVDYHPYDTRSHYPPGPYLERQPYIEVGAANYMGGTYGPYMAGGPGSEYASYPKPMAAPHHPTPEYYYPDNRGGPAVQRVAMPHGEYQERRDVGPYPEAAQRQYPNDQRPYPGSYPSPRPPYPPEQRPRSSYNPGHPQQFQGPSQTSRLPTPPHPPQGSPQYREPTSTSGYLPRSRGEGSPPYNATTYHSSPQSRGTGTSIHDGMREEPQRRTSPDSGESDISSMGRSTPVVRENRSSRGSAEDRGPMGQGDPVKVETEPVPPKSNSNLWQLVSVATDEE